MIRKLAATSLLLAVFAVPQSGFAQAPDWAKIRIGVEANYPPFSQMSAGIMPSHSCDTMVHSALIWAQMAFAMSMSKPENLPSGLIIEKGG